MQNLRANIFRSGVLRTTGRDAVRRPAPSLFAFLGLEAHPWHATCAGTLHGDGWATALEAETCAIRDEYVKLRSTTESDYELKGDEHSLHDGKWEWRSFIKKGQKDAAFADACPRTAAALEAVPGLQTGIPFAYSFFSSMGSGAHIATHTSACNVRLRGHLPLIVPDGDVGITVGGETRRYTEGELLLFDDAYPHETWHRGEDGQERVVLLFDIWHPDLTEEERSDVQSMFAVAQAQHRPPADSGDNSTRRRSGGGGRSSNSSSMG